MKVCTIPIDQEGVHLCPRLAVHPAVHGGGRGGEDCLPQEVLLQEVLQDLRRGKWGLSPKIKVST